MNSRHLKQKELPCLSAAGVFFGGRFRELTARFLQPSNFAPLRPRYVLMSKGAPRRLPL